MDKIMMNDNKKDNRIIHIMQVKKSIYSTVVKRIFDILLSFSALICLSWLYIVIIIVIKIDDPGPAMFFQKRVGKKKDGNITYFKLAKFRSMRMSTPHDTPTHMLENPDQYITKVGRFLRKSSLDELPQIIHILSGKMSLIGPRPALWNQNDLIIEREKYGANNIAPGLTGWAQVNGRDELEISDKAKLDGIYAQNVSLKMDWTCFWMTVGNVLKSKGVVEGGTGIMVKQIKRRGSEISATKEQNETSINKETIK